MSRPSAPGSRPWRAVDIFRAIRWRPEVLTLAGIPGWWRGGVPVLGWLGEVGGGGLQRKVALLCWGLREGRVDVEISFSMGPLSLEPEGRVTMGYLLGISRERQAGTPEPLWEMRRRPRLRPLVCLQSRSSFRGAQAPVVRDPQPRHATPLCPTHPEGLPFLSPAGLPRD